MTKHPINRRTTTMSNYQYRPSDHLAGSRSYIHGPLEPLDYPTTRRRTRAKLLALGLIVGLLLWGFDHMMDADKANLCASDATAYEGCRR